MDSCVIKKVMVLLFFCLMMFVWGDCYGEEAATRNEEELVK